MTTYTWTGGAGTSNWYDATNWQPDTSAPGTGAGTGASVIIDTPGVSIGGLFSPVHYTIASLTLTDGTVNNGTYFNVTGAMTLAAATYDENGIGSFGSLALTQASTFALYGGPDTISGTLSLANVSTLSLFGSLTVSGALSTTGTQSTFNIDGGTFAGASANDTAAQWDISKAFFGSTGSVAFSGLVAGSGDTFTFGDTAADTLSFGAQGSSFGGTIANFGGSNVIDLTKLTWNPGYTIAPTAGGSGVTISLGTTVEFTFASLSLAAGQTMGLALTPDNGTGTAVIIACFAAGTRIATVAGETPVEELRAGDLVRTRNGLRPIVWIGRRTIDLTRHPHPEQARPIRIRVGAFAPGLPARDLLLSPDHAVYWNGYLAEAKSLVNATSITQDRPDRVTYFHIELAAHDIVFAESLPTETYLDTGNRGTFENAAEPRILHPSFTGSRGGKTCAPMTFHGAPLAAIRAHLLARAEQLGAATTTDPALHILAGTTRIDPEILPDGTHRFTIPPGVKTVRLRSRAGAPAHLLADSSDDRTLGAFITRIARRTKSGRPRAIPLASPALATGWHPPEAGGRWTDGDAVLPIAGPCILELAHGGTLPYPGTARPASISAAA